MMSYYQQRRDMMKKFFIVIIAIVTAYLQIMFFVQGQEKFSELENRELQVFPKLELNGLLSGKFQSEYENALKDQIWQRGNMILAVNRLKGASKKYVNNIYEDIKDEIEIVDTGIKAMVNVNATEASIISEESVLDCRLEPAGDTYRINDTDYLTGYPRFEDANISKNISIKARQLDEVAKRHPDIKVYAYYITKSQDLNWFDKSEGIKSFDYGVYLSDKLSSDVKYGRLNIPGLSEYEDWFYKTDHHWNHKGAYQGYLDVYQLMKEDFQLSEVKKPVKEQDFGGGIFWYGSKAKSGKIELSPDDFRIYEYDLGPHTSYLGDDQAELNLYDKYMNGDINRSKYAYHYIVYYGYENDLIRHEFPGNKYNLLIIGDSNNRPMRKVLASHFSTIYFLDYRLLKDFDFDNMLKEKNIDAVLFMGELGFWNGYFIPGYPQEG